MKQSAFTRVHASLLILLGIAILLFSGMRIVSYHCRQLQQQLTVISEAALQEDMETAEAALQAFQRQWDESCPLLKLFVPRQSVMDLNTTIAKLLPLAQANSEELSAECHAISAILEWLQPLH